MTALLQCDGCGNVVGERADDESDPTRTWWCLTPAPSITAGLLPILTLSPGEDWTSDDRTNSEDETPLDPPRHFCSEDCGEAWFTRRREEREATAP